MYKSRLRPTAQLQGEELKKTTNKEQTKAQRFIVDGCYRTNRDPISGVLTNIHVGVYFETPTEGNLLPTHLVLVSAQIRCKQH